MAGRVHGAVWVSCTLCLYSVVAGQWVDTSCVLHIAYSMGPILAGHRRLAKGVVSLRYWSVFRVGVAAYPARTED